MMSSSNILLGFWFWSFEEIATDRVMVYTELSGVAVKAVYLDIFLRNKSGFKTLSGLVTGGYKVSNLTHYTGKSIQDPLLTVTSALSEQTKTRYEICPEDSVSINGKKYLLGPEFPLDVPSETSNHDSQRNDISCTKFSIYTISQGKRFIRLGLTPTPSAVKEAFVQKGVRFLGRTTMENLWQDHLKKYSSNGKNSQTPQNACQNQTRLDLLLHANDPSIIANIDVISTKKILLSLPNQTAIYYPFRLNTNFGGIFPSRVLL